MNRNDTTPPPDPRRHDLDALRAAAMLLGIVYHCALSFAIGDAWMVRDVRQSKVLFVFQDFVHGFRMPLFILVSGFFTAMLWRQKGLKALLWHRCRRVLFPCLLGLVTVVPAMTWASGYATASGAARRQRQAAVETASTDLWAAIRLGDAAALERQLHGPAALTDLHPAFGVTPLTWSALVGQQAIAETLIDRGADVSARNRDGGTALHAAAFLGRDGIVELLLRKGAKADAASSSGDVPMKSAAQPWPVVEYITQLLGITVDAKAVAAGREKVVAQLTAAGAPQAVAPGRWAALGETYRWLIETPVFILVWFLWFLVWLVAIFAGYAWIAERTGFKGVPLGALASPWTLLVLVPLTMLPSWWMGFGGGEFGPDTSMGILPQPWVLGYYAVFFFFGVLYHDADDRQGRLGRTWRWLLPVALLVFFPIGLEFATGVFGFREVVPEPAHKAVSVTFQSLYAWLMSFAWMGMFRSLLTRENKAVRYLSDSAYWLYLVHLPLAIVGQTLIAEWQFPAALKLSALSAVLIPLLLLSYHILVRYTWVGRLLNGPRLRPGRPSSAMPPGPVATP